MNTTSAAIRVDLVIIDTSALVAVLNQEDGSEPLFDALAAGNGYIPAPVMVEFERVTALEGNRPDPKAAMLLQTLLSFEITIVAFDASAAAAAVAANRQHGSGNGQGAKLNVLDLMVYGVAKATGLPILCTGKDFASTDALLHPASRIG